MFGKLLITPKFEAVPPNPLITWGAKTLSKSPVISKAQHLLASPFLRGTGGGSPRGI
jgi:hypothetical protein